MNVGYYGVYVINLVLRPYILRHVDLNETAAIIRWHFSRNTAVNLGLSKYDDILYVSVISHIIICLSCAADIEEAQVPT